MSQSDEVAKLKESLIACKCLANAISPSLYSEGNPPKPLNDLFLAWVDNHRTPTMAQVSQAIQQSNEIRKAGKQNGKPVEDQPLDIRKD
jgi:hypothetical protein